jgi:hypothetical protein
MSRRRTPSQVRPRPPVDARRRPVRTRPIAPSGTRLAPHRKVERGPGLPLVVRGALVVAIVVLVGAVAIIGSQGVAPVVAAIGDAFGGVVDRIGATPEPASPTPEPVSDAPSIVPPEEPFTRAETVDVTVTVPRSVTGTGNHSVRLYVTLTDQPTALVGEAEIGVSPTVVIPAIPLGRGRNSFHATVAGPSTESDPSEVVAWVLDRARPPITIGTPRVDGAVVNRSTLGVAGKTQSRSTVSARNEANGVTATTTAAADGTFTVNVPLAAGTNGITLRVTDPAGNTNTAVVTVIRGSGKVQAQLSASAYRFSARRLPDDVEFRLTIRDPDGRPMVDALVLFTITVPGVEPIVSSELPTGGDGIAVFRTEIPRGATPGGGLVSVLVTTQEFGTLTDRQVLTITR